MLRDSLWRLAYRVAYHLLLLYWFLLRPRVDAAHVAVWCRGRVLLIQDSYRRCRTLPAGGIRRGEPPAAAAARELVEEVGIQVAPSDLTLAREIEMRYEFKREHSLIFEIVLPAEPELRVDGREVVWAGFVDPRDRGPTSLGVSPIVASYLEGTPRDAT